MISLKELNSKIKSLGNTGKITKAMQLIAANRLAKSKKHLQDSKAYKEVIDRLFHEALLHPLCKEHPLIKGVPDRSSFHDGQKDNPSMGPRVHLLLISSQRGLCGPYNNNAIRQATKTLTEWVSMQKEVRLHCFGKKGYDAFKDEKNLSPKRHDGALLERADIEHSEALSKELLHLYQQGEADEVYVLYHAFESSMKQRLKVEILLPMEVAVNSTDASQNVPLSLYEPGSAEVIDALLRKRLEFQIYHAFLNAQTSEHASRMTAMDNATRKRSRDDRQLYAHEEPASVRRPLRPSSVKWSRERRR